MKAATLRLFGSPDHLEVTDVKTPEPKADEVLVKIHASGITAGDCEIRSMNLPWEFRVPLRLGLAIQNPQKILGQEYSGVVTKVGDKVTDFKVGDQVFGPTDMKLGAHAEYICLKESLLITKKPSGLSHDQAATLSTGGLNAVFFLNMGGLKAGQRLLIVGAGGSIGTYAVQMAKSMGLEVCAVDEASKFKMLESIGADQVIDYQKEDFTKQSDQYDVILDIVNRRIPDQALRPLRAGGLYLVTNPTIATFWQMKTIRKPEGKRVKAGIAPYHRREMDQLLQLVEARSVKPVIDRTFKLSEIAEAHRYVETGKKAGNVVIQVCSE